MEVKSRAESVHAFFFQQPRDFYNFPPREGKYVSNISLVEQLPTIGTCASLKSVRLQRRSQVTHNYLCFHIYPCKVFVARCSATQFWLECQTISFFY